MTAPLGDPSDALVVVMGENLMFLNVACYLLDSERRLSVVAFFCEEFMALNEITKLVDNAYAEPSAGDDHITPFPDVIGRLWRP